MTTAPTKTKRKPKPLALAPPPTIPAPQASTPPQRPIGELEALAANFQYLSDRIDDIAMRGDLPPNAHEFITRAQQAVNNLATYTRKVKDRDLKEYRTTLANHQIGLVLRIAGVAIATVFLSLLFSNQNAQPNQTTNQPALYSPNPGSIGLQPP